jgi:hypothetical protein
MAQAKRVLGNAIKLAGLFFILSILAIIVLGVFLQKHPTGLSIAYAVGGAVLQAASLTLVYEVWLRNEVEDATLEELGTSRDVREHGLIRLDGSARVDWPDLLSTARELCVVTTSPSHLIGMAEDEIIRRAAEGKLVECRIAVPADHWDESESLVGGIRGAMATRRTSRLHVRDPTRRNAAL